MNKTIFLPALLVAGALFSGCSQDEEANPGKGTLKVDLRAETAFNQTRGIDQDAYKDITQYTVTLVDTQTGQVVKRALYGDWELAYQVESNKQYTLSASYGEEVPASYDKLLCYGDQTFTVLPGTTKTVAFTATPRAAKVSVDYSDDFTTYCKDCEVSVKTQYMDAPEVININKAGQELFLKAGENEPVTLDFKVIGKDGEVLADKSETRTVEVSPRTWLKVIVKPDVTQIEGGKFGINVIVDNGVTEENIDFIVPNDVFN